MRYTRDEYERFLSYYCPVKLLKRKKLRAESICGFSPNCYLCFRHKISDNMGKVSVFFGQPPEDT